MFSKLRRNYRLSNVLVRIAFVLAYVLYSWQNILATTQLMMQMYGMTTHASGVYVLLMSIFVSLLIGVVIMFLVPFLANTFLNFSRFYNVPRAEYGLIVHVFFTIFYFACGALSLLHLITPILLTWGEKMFPFIAATGCMIGFYAVTKKLYFNDVTSWYYFRNLAIVYFVFAFIFGVVL